MSSNQNTRHLSSLAEYEISLGQAHGEKINVIPLIPTNSKHRDKATAILNSYANKNPDAVNTLYALVTYPVQKWAHDARERLHLTDDSARALSQASMEIYAARRRIIEISGMTSKFNFTNYTERINESAEIISLVEEATEYLDSLPAKASKTSRVIRTLHFLDNKSRDVSPYIINEYYMDALELIYDKFGQRFNDAIVKLVADTALSEKFLDEQISDGYSRHYHNTDSLLRLFPYVKDRSCSDRTLMSASDRKLQKMANDLDVLHLVSGCVDEIRSYPSGGERYHEILTLVMEGLNDQQIAERLCLKRLAVTKLRKSATNLLSFVLWGYTAREIINSLRPPVTRKDISRLYKAVFE